MLANDHEDGDDNDGGDSSEKLKFPPAIQA